MRSLSMKLLPAGAVMIFFFSGCGGEGGPSGGSGSGADTLDTASATHGATEVLNVGGRLFNVPSPVETALLIKRSGAAYHKDRTLGLELSEKLPGKLQRALALGMYGADLAYVTIHRDGSRALTTMQTVEKLGAALEMGNAFDRTLIERFRDNINNEDSLLRMSGDAFGTADRYLKNNERNDVSALVLAGGWIESMHLILSEGGLNDQLATRVGEQKRTVRDLISLVENADHDKAAGQLVAGLKDLAGILSMVNTSYQFSEPTTDVPRRTTTITSKSSVTITAQQIAALGEKIAGLRALLTA